MGVKHKNNEKKKSTAERTAPNGSGLRNPAPWLEWIIVVAADDRLIALEGFVKQTMVRTVSPRAGEQIECPSTETHCHVGSRSGAGSGNKVWCWNISKGPCAAV